MNLRIVMDYKATKRMLKNVGGRDIPDARRDALNRAAASSTTDGARIVKSLSDLSYASAKRKFKVAKAKGREGWRANSAKVYFKKTWSGGVGTLPVVKSGRGVSVAGGPVSDGAFAVYSGKNNKNTIYRRIGRDRYPITMAKAEIGGTMDQAVRTAVRFKANKVFKERFPHELDYRLKKRAGLI